MVNAATAIRTAASTSELQFVVQILDITCIWARLVVLRSKMARAKHYNNNKVQRRRRKPERNGCLENDNDITRVKGNKPSNLGKKPK